MVNGRLSMVLNILEVEVKPVLNINIPIEHRTKVNRGQIVIYLFLTTKPVFKIEKFLYYRVFVKTGSRSKTGFEHS
jgi:hypothetical protein